MCQTACNAGAAACYAGFGFVFGTITAGAGVPAAVAGCNATLGACMAACHTKFVVEAGTEAAATGGFALPLLALGGLTVALYGAASTGPSPSSSPSQELFEKIVRKLL